MNEIVTASIVENNIEFLERFPKSLMLETEAEAVGFILDYKKKFEKTPSLMTVMEEFEAFIPFKFEPSLWETDPPNLKEIYTSTVARKTQGVIERKSRKADILLRKGEFDGYYEIIDEIQKLRPSKGTIERKARSMTDLTEVFPPREYIWGKIVEDKSVVVLAGDGGTNKTNIALALLLHVAGGRSFVGWPVKQAPTLFVNCEMGEEAFQRKINQIIKGAGIPRGVPLHWITDYSLPLTDDGIAREIVGEAKRVGAKLIVIDALMDVLNGKSDSDEEAVKKVFKNAKLIRDETGASVVVLHHLNKSGGYRGSSVILGDPDLLLNLSLVGDGKATIESKKDRGIPVMPFTLEVFFDDDEETVSFEKIDTIAVTAGKSKTKVDHSPLIENMIREHQEETGQILVDSVMLQESVMSLASCSKSTVQKTLAKMLADGTVNKAKNGRKWSWFFPGDELPKGDTSIRVSA